MINYAYKRKLQTCEGMVNFVVEIESLNAGYSVYCRFFLNNTLAGEFDGIFINSLFIHDWKQAFQGRLQREAFMNFLNRQPEKVLRILTQLKVLVLYDMKLKPEFRGKGLGVQILKELIVTPSSRYTWDVAFGWARPCDGKCEKKQLNQVAAKMLGHYLQHLPNCVAWTKRSTFFLCAPGQFQAANAAELLHAVGKAEFH